MSVSQVNAMFLRRRGAVNDHERHAQAAGMLVVLRAMPSQQRPAFCRGINARYEAHGKPAPFDDELIYMVQWE